MSTTRAQTRHQLVKAIRDRYLASSSSEKRRILDEFVALTGYHRKYAIRVLRSQRLGPVSRSPRGRVYDEVVRDALVVVWEASNRLCGKRLKPLLPVLVPALEKYGHLSLDEAVRSRVLVVSAATIDRLLASKRAAARGHPRKQRVQLDAPYILPVHEFAGGKQLDPGYLAIELVAHGGDNARGRSAHTLVLTDIASGWTECVALRVREAVLVLDGLERLRKTMPFPLRGIASDDASKFLDDTVLVYCGKHQIEFIRSRPHGEKGQAGSKQKQGSVVRRLTGNGRLAGPRSVEVLERLYTAFRRFVNFFQPSFKQAEKKRAGARVSKRYLSPQTPCARLLASPIVDQAMKHRLRTVLATLDPLRLLEDIRAAQQHLAGLAAGDVHHGDPDRDPELDRLPGSRSMVRQEGEVDPGHRPGPEPPRPWRTRVDPFDRVWPRVVTWLEAEPTRTAKELLQRLREDGHGAFPYRQLRTLQRRVKEWRRAMKPARPS